MKPAAFGNIGLQPESISRRHYGFVDVGQACYRYFACRLLYHVPFKEKIDNLLSEEG